MMDLIEIKKKLKKISKPIQKYNLDEK